MTQTTEGWPFSHKATRLILSALSTKREIWSNIRRDLLLEDGERADMDNDISYLDALVKAIEAQPVKEAPRAG